MNHYHCKLPFCTRAGSDFGHDNELVHTFEAVSSLGQMYTFDIYILDDDRNELEEEFVALIDVTRIQNEEQDTFDPDISERLYTTITIGIDPDNPDSESLPAVKLSLN